MKTLEEVDKRIAELEADLNDSAIKSINTRPLLKRYVTRDEKHLKYITYRISFSGNNEYLSSLYASIWDEEKRRYHYVTLVSDSTRTSVQDALEYCEQMKTIIIDKLKYDYTHNIYNGDLYKLRDDLLVYCKYKHSTNDETV